MINIPEKERYIWEIYSFTCLWCMTTLASCLHESPPKSLNPKWEDFPESRFPVCNTCHDKAHSMNWRKSLKILEENRAKHFPNALEKINERRSQQK